jgi:hypothetical protein
LKSVSLMSPRIVDRMIGKYLGAGTIFTRSIRSNSAV